MVTTSASGVDRYVEQAGQLLAKRKAYRAGVRRLKFDTIADLDQALAKI
jgi:hypothetical protein